jgi:hypothetical protein
MPGMYIRHLTAALKLGARGTVGADAASERDPPRTGTYPGSAVDYRNWLDLD